MTQTPQQPEDAPMDESGDAWALGILDQIVSTMGSALPSTVEIVLHDLAKIPNSIISVSGDVTRRRIGDPATDVLLQAVVSGEADSMIGYQTRLPDGRELRSSTLLIRNAVGKRIAALCVNVDVSAWLMMRDLVTSVLQPLSAGVGTPVRPGATSAPSDLPVAAPLAAMSTPPGVIPNDVAITAPVGETFPRDVDELAAHLLAAAVADIGVPIELMKKEHKLAVVAELRARGMFLLRDAVEMVAGHLRVTRFTIYNYLNELERSTPNANELSELGS